jgi:ligand-binding sensor domain-containing protein/signal transduction histidine kinase
MSHAPVRRWRPLALDCALLAIAFQTGIGGCIAGTLPAAESGSAAFSPELPAALCDKPVIGKNADGHLEVFRVRADGEIQHRWEKPASGDWSSWSGLGAPFLPGIAVTTNGQGQLTVYAVSSTNQSLWERHQIVTNGVEWSGWENRGGTLQSPVAVGRNAVGELQVFGVNPDGNVVTCSPSADGGPKWRQLGGEVMTGLRVARNRDGRLELFAIAAQAHTLQHRFEQPLGSGSVWSEWESLGGAVAPGFVVSQNIQGRLEVFGVNRTNGSIERICQQSPGGESWTDWRNFGGRFKPGIAVGQSRDGRLEILAVAAADGKLQHRWETLTDGSDKWSEWASHGAQVEPFPAVVQNGDGNLEVFAVDHKDSGKIMHRRQISRASDWLDWCDLDRLAFQYNARTWQVGDGLPDNDVRAIAQTRDGYLWVGTPAGLARFDGMAFTSFDVRNGAQPLNASITCLCADRDGGLWIGTDGGGLGRLKDGVFWRWGRTNGLAGESLNVIYQSEDGALWIGTTNGMSRFKDGKFINYGREQGLSSDVVRAIYEDRQRELWIATGAGLNRLRGDKMEAFAMPNGLPNDSVRCICQDRGGRVWIGSNNGMLWHSSYWNTFYAYNLRYGISDSFVSAICEDRDGNLWVGTYSGLNRFREGKFFPELNNEGAPFDRVNALLQDTEGNIWVGSREGLSRLTPKSFVTFTKKDGLSHNNIMSVLESGSGGLWVGTWGGGLDLMKDERVTSFPLTNKLSQALVLALCEARDGSLWVGADFDGGLGHLHDGKFTRYATKDGLSEGAVRVLHEDRGGKLWIGTSGGLTVMNGGSFKRYSTRDGLGANGIRAILETHDGALWFGTEGGLSRWTGGGFTNLSRANGLADDSVTALFEDEEHCLWVGTVGGLTRLHAGVCRTFTSHEGLYDDKIFEIIGDGQGWLWFTCPRGIFRVRKSDFNDVEQGRKELLTSIVYGKTDGLESTECNGAAKPSACRTRDGRLWFATSKGLTSVAPETANLNLVPPPVYIESVTAERRLLLEPIRRPSDVTAESPSSGLWLLRVPPGRGEMEFHYTALNFQAPESCRFKYKLEGVDSDWIEAGSRRTAHYNNLYPGDYQFRVMACNKNGVWSSQAASLAVNLQPHLWQRGWLRVSAALLVIGAASGLARYSTRKRMQRRLELAEHRHAVERERGRIAKDIHDDLGSSLTRIMMLGERAEDGLEKREDVGVHVQKIVASARNTVQALDEIVWAVNPENDSLEGLIEYLAHYADEFFEETEIHCRLQMPLEIPPLELPAEVRHGLFMVVKEVFHNVLKHARATEVRVQLVLVRERLELQIEDNGCGFEPTQNGSGRQGNGLGNMRKRIGELGGQIEITSEPGAGTRVKISAPLKSAAPKLAV